MQTKMTRRLALALPFAIPTIGTIDALAEAPATIAEQTPDTEPVIISGLNQIKTLHLFAIVKTPDGRNGVVQLTCTGDEDGVQVLHIGDSARQGDFTAHVSVDPYATLPTWLLRECGLAALSATPSTWGGVK